MPVIIDSYSETNQTATFTLTTSASSNAAGQTFTGNGKKIYSAKFNINKTGSPTGPMTAKIYAVTGTFGTSSCVPTGSALATSASIDAATLGTTAALFEFLFSTNTVLTNATNYAVVLDVSGTVSDPSNRVLLGQQTSGATHPGNRVNFDNSISGAWAGLGSADACFYVYGQSYNGNALLLFI